MDFEKAFKCILKFEGGFVNDADDLGGVTKYGISKNSYPHLDIASLTIEDAKAIYKRDFWDSLHLDSFPASVRLPLFDSAINCGAGSAIKFLQRALQVEADGKIGPSTIQAIESASGKDSAALVSDIMWHRYKRVSQLDSFTKFGAGWVRRMMNVAALSVA